MVQILIERMHIFSSLFDHCVTFHIKVYQEVSHQLFHFDFFDAFMTKLSFLAGTNAILEMYSCVFVSGNAISRKNVAFFAPLGRLLAKTSIFAGDRNRCKHRYFPIIEDTTL